MAIFPLGGVVVPTLGRSFLGTAVPVAYFWYTEAPRNVSHHSESGGRSWPAPHPKAIAHPFLWPFSVDELCAPAFGRLFLGTTVPTAYFWHSEVPRNVSHNSESGG